MVIFIDCFQEAIPDGQNVTTLYDLTCSQVEKARASGRVQNGDTNNEPIQRRRRLAPIRFVACAQMPDLDRALKMWCEVTSEIDFISCEIGDTSRAEYFQNNCCAIDMNL